MLNIAQHSFAPRSHNDPSQAQATPHRPAQLSKPEPSPTDTSPTSHPAPPRNTGLLAQFADQENLKLLGQKLQQIADTLGKEAMPSAVLAALGSTAMNIHPDSSYAQEATGSVTLDTFIKTFLGLRLPINHFQLLALCTSVIDRSMVHPLGDLGGALSWPAPLSVGQQRQLRASTLNHPHALGSQPLVMQTKGGVLAFLGYRQALPKAPGDDPAKTLHTLLSTPQAQLMGKDLQERMRGIASDRSVMDYLLAGIGLQLDPESITSPHRNKIAGFDLASDKHWGKPASTVVAGLAQWLVAKGRTTPEMANVGAYLLLASRAPVYLIKDIPDSAKYGSPAWVNLAVAAATIEAQTPGKVPNMTFAQVMLAAQSASLADPLVTQIAQREALIDWGAVNGVPDAHLRAKHDSAYTAQELSTLVTAFNARKSMMAQAAQSFDEDLPSRKELALAVLKQRFPQLEHLFEERVINVQRKETGRRGQDRWVTAEVGPHSLLDIAMMDLPGPRLVFSSSDSRVPVAALNANPRFGVADTFEAQYKSVVEKKKQATGTYIRHLISQLPAKDRKNFETGKITFYQNHSKTLGTGFFGSTADPKGEALLVKTEREGVTTAYQIDFNAGRIATVPEAQVTPGAYRIANRAYETKVFKPAGGEALSEPGEASSSALPADTFGSSRVQLIADAFIEHINLDDNALKQQARGQTTADKNRARADAVSDFVLDLIPFRSAINNFRAGDIGAGVLDLGLDLFGFLTAGVATTGKVVKIAGTSASRLSKGLRVAKAIGMATFSTLNPLGGLGDVAVGGARLAGNGLQFVGAKGLKNVNRLRGATGSYDLLKTVSRDHGAVATGTLKIGDSSIDSAAVLKNGRWYAFDANTLRAYGSPLSGFAPSTVAIKGEINQSFSDWLYRQLAGDTASPQGLPSVLGQYVPAQFEEALKAAKSPEKRAAFDFGYAYGNPDKVPGYSSDMTIVEIQTLASQRFLSAEDVGTLIKQIERRKIKLVQDGFMLFQHDIHAAGGTLTAMPQEMYLSLVNIASQGECAGMANALALALMHGKETTFLGNVFTAAGQLSQGKKLAFVDDLTNFHNAVNGAETFHMGKPVRQLPYQKIADEVAEAAPPNVLRIATLDHALLAGVVTRDGKPSWFYFDPNFGLAQFPSAEAFKNGLERTLNRGTSPFQLRAHGNTLGAPEYRVSRFEVGDLASYRDAQAVQRLATDDLQP